MKTGCILTMVALSCFTLAQDASTPALRAGIHVQMASASHAIAMPDADASDATVLALKDTGEVFIGTRRATLAEVAKVPSATVYVKADARVRYQSLLGVLDALHGHAVVLLAEPPIKPPTGQTLPPYGVALGSVH